MGKLLRLKKMTEDAAKIYSIGLKRAEKDSQHYGELQRQLQATTRHFPAIDDSVNPSHERGHILSLPPTVLCAVMRKLDAMSLANFASARSELNVQCRSALYSGSLGSVRLDRVRTTRGMADIQRQFDPFSTVLVNAQINVSTEVATRCFLASFLDTYKKNPGKSCRITRLCIGPIGYSTARAFLECLKIGLGVSLKRLVLQLGSFSEQSSAAAFVFSLLDSCELQELELIVRGQSLVSDQRQSFRAAKTLESLVLDVAAGVALFFPCTNLRLLSCPSETDTTQFNSDQIELLDMRLAVSDAHRPQPVRFLRLSQSCGPVQSIDLDRYSYVSVEVLHLSGVSFSQTGGNGFLCKSTGLDRLHTLRLERVAFENPVDNLTATLARLPSLRVLEIADMTLTRLAGFDAYENGAWLVQQIFRTQRQLRHLIFRDLQLGPAAVSALMRGLQTRAIPDLQVFGLVNVQVPGVSLDALFRLYAHQYKHSHLLTTPAHMHMYNQRFNLFTRRQLADL